MGGEEGSCLATIRVHHSASRDILKAIQPDNVIVPEWLSIDCRDLDGVLECTVRVDCRIPSRILSLRNTLDDLLRAIRVAIDVIEGSRNA